MGRFVAALRKIGPQHFPVLVETPGANDTTAPAASAEALKELAFFQSQPSLGTRTILVDAATQEEVADYLAYQGTRQLECANHAMVTLDDHELVAADTRDGAAPFRSSRFRQFCESGESVRDGSAVVWQDVATGNVYRPNSPLGPVQNGQSREHYPGEFKVERVPHGPADFANTVRALEKVFSASVATGNSVRWGF